MNPPPEPDLWFYLLRILGLAVGAAPWLIWAHQYGRQS
jgi:hypothetical protein